MKRSITSLAGIALIAALPAVAQPAPPPAASPAPSPPSATAPRGNARILFGTVQKTQNQWRARTIVNARVNDDNGRRIATVTDLLLTDDGHVDRVVLGVAGASRRFVAVPFSQLRFVTSQGAPPVVGAPTGLARINGPDLVTYAIILPGATRESLLQGEQFRF